MNIEIKRNEISHKDKNPTYFKRLKSSAMKPPVAVSTPGTGFLEMSGFYLKIHIKLL